jgi:uncharacterized protein (TIGR02145 family)
VAGGKLKQAGTIYWNSPNTGATNEIGFTALPGGYRYDDGTFYYMASNGYRWSSTEFNTTNAWGRYLGNNFSGIGNINTSKSICFSVRCVED